MINCQFMRFVWKAILLVPLLSNPLLVYADMSAMHHEATVPVYSVAFNKLEWQKNPDEEALLGWDFAAWIEHNHVGRWWIKSEGKVEKNNTENSNVQLIYSHPVSAFWDVQAGLHSRQEPDQTGFLMLGMFGLAPYFVHIDSYVLLGKGGESIVKFEADYDWQLTRDWVALIDSGLTVNAQKNIATLSGSGVSEVDAGLRFAYHKQRKFVPYIGIEWEKAFGNTASLRESLSIPVSEWHGVFGFNVWY